MERTLGEDTTTYTLKDAAALENAADELMTQARRSIRIFSPDMDSGLLDRDIPVQALRQMTRSRHTRARILVMDSSSAIRQGHRFIDLVQRFATFIQLRIISDEDRGRLDSWMVVDDTGLLYRPDYRRLADGHVCFHDVSRAPKLTRDFDEWWERGESDPELRRLFI